MRRRTREVFVGNVGVGGDNPIRIQSMTTTKTSDIQATIEQVMALADAGCEIVRVTVQGKKEADACEHIKNGLLQRGYSTPLVADIHFYPPAALRVVEFVDKVRINPGNYLDRRATFQSLIYTDESYAEELQKIEEKFSLLVEKCKRYKRSLRIGTNHGSLSDRIMSHFGDSPKGMVESALEYARICRKLDYHDFIFSMKASNPLVMSEAYRLLVDEMDALGWDYPLHLGVTEAGAGMDGRMKSAAGIGGLLLDGLGDTIRVSLAEDPIAEIPACGTLVTLRQDKGDYRLLTVDHATINEKGTVFVLLEDGEIGEGNADMYLQKNAQIPGSFDDKVLLVECRGNCTSVAREVDLECKKRGMTPTIILKKRYEGTVHEIALRAGAEMGGALMEGIAHGVCIEADLPIDVRERMSFSLLQGCRMRMTKTEFIACPSCGRTLFDLMEVTQRIEAKTSHLPGVKIAIMGCIVNGPGEMADADFGYVGSRSGMIDLYVGKTCVERNIPEHEADERLIQLIQQHGMWIEPVEAEINNSNRI